MLLVTIHMEKCGNAIKKNKQKKKPPWVRQNSYKSASLLRKNQF